MQSPQPFKVCPQCQQAAVIDASQCQRCGRVFRSVVLPAITPPLPPHPSLANTCAKWGVIGWSGFCLLGIVVGIVNVSATPAHSEAQEVGRIIGMALWAFVWLAIAGPCALVYFLTRPKG